MLCVNLSKIHSNDCCSKLDSSTLIIVYDALLFGICFIPFPSSSQANICIISSFTISLWLSTDLLLTISSLLLLHLAFTVISIDLDISFIFEENFTKSFFVLVEHVSSICVIIIADSQSCCDSFCERDFDPSS